MIATGSLILGIFSLTIDSPDDASFDLVDSPDAAIHESKFLEFFAPLFDIREQEFPDLAQEKPKAVKGRNAFELLNGFEVPNLPSNLSRRLRLLLKEETAWDAPLGDTLIQETIWSEGVVAKLEACSHLRYPDEQDETLIFLTAPPLTQTLCLRHRKACSRSRYDEALRHLKSIQSIAQLFKESNGPIRDQLIGEVIQSVLNREIQWTLKFHSPPEKSLVEYLELCSLSFEDSERRFRSSLKKDFRRSVNQLEKISLDPGLFPKKKLTPLDNPLTALIKLPEVRHLLFYKKNRTIRRTAESYRDLATILGKRPHERPPAKDQSLFDLVRPTLFGNRTGYRIYQRNFFDPGITFRTTDRNQAKSDLLKIAIALKIHEKRAGTLPKTLEALTPAILPALPKDHFSKENYRYDPEKRRVWSVGRDFIDEGGLEHPEILKGMGKENTGIKRPDRTQEGNEPTIWLWP
ncbi:MAG: hypothetical protein ACON5N_06200 [Akkermansiaceae bacterium]